MTLFFRKEISALFFANGESQFFHGGEHVFPDHAFLTGAFGLAEKIGGVVGYAQWDALELMPGVAELADWFGFLQKTFDSCSSEGDDDLRLHHVDFRPQEREIRCHFIRGGLPASHRLIFGGWSKFADVGNVDFIP